MKRQPQKGDYVLATKYPDGDPKDGQCVGFYDRYEYDRHFVVDSNGQQFRGGSGFRRCEVISQERGEWIVKNMRLVEQSCRSVWFWKYCAKKVLKEMDGFCD